MNIPKPFQDACCRATTALFVKRPCAQESLLPSKHVQGRIVKPLTAHYLTLKSTTLQWFSYKPLGLALFAACMVSACASQVEDAAGTIESVDILAVPSPSLGNVEYYTHKLAAELFSQTQPSNQSRYAVVNFVPVPAQVFAADQHHPLQLLGHQLKEGLITEAAKRGYTTQEFLLTGDIKVSEMSDAVLSRDVESLSANHRVDYFITGTVLHQERGAMVNARMVHARSQEVIAAATTFFPAELFWQTERVTLRNGRLLLQQPEISTN